MPQIPLKMAVDRIDRREWRRRNGQESCEMKEEEEPGKSEVSEVGTGGRGR